MARSDDILKKYGVTQVTGGSGKTASSSGSNSSGSSKSILDKYGVTQVRGGKTYDAEKIRDWFNGTSSALQSGSQYLSKDGYRKPNTSFSSLYEKYMNDANDIARFLEDNKSSMENYGDVLDVFNKTVSYLRKINSNIQKSNEFFSQFSGEDEYNKWNAYSTPENRQKRYDENQQKLEELKQKRQASYVYQPGQNPYLSVGASSGAGYAASMQGVDTARGNLSPEDRKELDKQIQAIETEMRMYERGETDQNGFYYGSKVIDDYGNLRNNADFGAVASKRDYSNPTKDDFLNYESSLLRGTWALEDGGYADDDGNIRDKDGNIVQYANAPAFEDKLGAYLSMSDEEKESPPENVVSGQGSYSSTWADIAIEGNGNWWNLLKPEEIDTYYYLMGTQGQDAAYKYLDDMSVELGRRNLIEAYKNIDNAGAFEKALMNVGSLAANQVSGILSTAGNIGDSVLGRGFNPYSNMNFLTNWSGYVRSSTAEDINEATGNASLPLLGFTWGDAYQSLMSGADSALGVAAFGKGYTALMSLDSASSEAIKLYQQGASPMQMALGSVAAGAAEYIFEKYSVDKLIDIGSPEHWWDILWNAFKQGGIELTEEAFTETANIISNGLIMQSQSDWAKTLEENGGDYKKALSEFAIQVANAGLGGFLSGAAGAIGRQGQNYVQTQAGNIRNGRVINASDGARDKLLSMALDKASESSGKMQRKIRSQANKVLGDNFVTKTGRNLATGRLYSTMQNVVTEQNIGEISAALQENCISKKEAKKIAGAYAVAANGIELSADQQKLLRKYADNEDVKSAIEKVVGDPESGVNKRAQSMMNFEFDTILSQIESTMQQAAPGQENASSMDNLSAQKNEPQTASYDVSEDGETHLISDPGKTVSVSGFASIDNGKAMLQLSDGSVVDAEDVSFGKSSDALVYSVVADMGVPISTANSIVHAFDPGKGVSAKMYAYGIQEAYNMGKRNEQLQNTENDPYAQAMKLAWNEGRITSIKESKTAQKAVNDNFRKAKESIRESGKEETSEHRAVLEEGITALSLNESQKASYNLADRIARAAKVDIIVYVGKTGENGYYDPKTDTIHLNLNAMNKNRMSMMAFTLGHELGHRAKNGSPEKFRAFADFLMEQYGKQGSDVNAMIAQEMDAAKEYGVEMTRDEAFEEVVCDACQRMLLDTDAGKKLARFGAESSQNKSIVSQIRRWISEFMEKLREIFAGVEPDSLAAQEFAKFDAGVKQILADMYVDMTIDAGEHLSTIQNALGTGTTVKANENGEFTMAKSKDGSKKVFNLQTWNNGGRETLEATLLREGYTREEVDAALTIMDGKQKLVEAIANEVDGNGKPAFPEQGRINEATLTTDIKDGHAVLSALVSNGDYPVNIDLLMVCKKRKAYQRVINRLCETGMIKQATVDALAIAEINKILGKYGFETACLGCFVESRRLRIQEWAQTIVREWNGEVKKRNPNAKSFGFGKGEATLTSEEVMQLIGELESGGKKNEQGNLNLGQGSSVKRMGVLLDKVPSLRRTLSVEDLITPDGLSALRRFDGNLFSIVKSRYGSNSPKFVQEFNPYNHELAKYGTVPTEYKFLRDYLYAIGGARMQSFSDFIVENWFDYCQIVADLSARNLPMHTYTKEISLAKLFGMTGIKINMSLIPDIDRSLGREYAGLTRNENGDLELIWADKDRFKATGGKSYMQSINFSDAIALQNDPRYSANVGTIAVGISDMHIRMMLNDPRIRMVIPYHSSGMNPIYADMMGTSYYKDYTNFQNTTVKQLYDSNGKPVSVKLDKTQTGKLTGGFQFNEVLQDLGDARAAAESYKEWCKNASLHTITINGETYTAELTPKFSQFAEEQNYYKLLEDFNTYDCITEEAAPQVDVQQVYPDGFEDILRAELSSQERYRQKQEKNQAFDKAMGEIESYLQNHTKADTVYYANQHGINLGAKDKKLNAADKAKLKQMQNDGKAFSLPKTDSEGNQLSEEQQEYFKESEVRDDDWNLIPVYHQTFDDFYTFKRDKLGKVTLKNANYASLAATSLVGHWFSDHDLSQNIGGKALKCYLDIKNPYYTDLDSLAAEIVSYADDAEKMQDHFEMGQFNMVRKAASEFVSWLRSNGYDGIFVSDREFGGTSYVILNSRQAKLTTNEKPTGRNDIRYSLRKRDQQDALVTKTDSEGNQLSEDQQEYFAGSKARDENGNLYVMYHGSGSPVFTEFDMQEGVWLTPDQRYAEAYADMWHSWRDEGKAKSGLEQSVYADPDYRLYKMYANITNPLNLGEINDDFDRSQMTRLAKLLGVPTSRIRSLAYDRYGDQTVSFVYQVTKQKEFIDIAREKGYDGFTATEKGTKTFCAFSSPNQVKLTTNEVPSSFSDIRYSLPKRDQLYMDAVNRGDMETAQKMVNERAEELRAEVFAQTDVPTYRIRRGATPKKTIKVYKVFTMSSAGKPSALFVSSQYDLPIGVWLDAQDTYHFTDQRNGHMYVPSTKNPNTKGGATGRSTNVSDISAEDISELENRGYLKRDKNGKLPKSITSLAYRPGWHAGDLPFFPQGGMQIEGSNYPNVHRYNQVVFECEMIADHDYTDYHVTEDGRVQLHDMQEMPKDGSYKYSTNPMAQSSDIGAWYIGSSIKIVRALTQAECDRILQEKGRPVQEWQAYQDADELKRVKNDARSLYTDKKNRDEAAKAAEYAYEHRYGALDLDALGYDPTQTDGGKKLLDAVTYDDDGKVIPLSERFDTTKTDIRYKIPVGEDTSPRALLANAFEGVVQTDIEKRNLEQYKEKVDMLNSEEVKLEDLRAQIRELSFAKGKRDNQKISDLQFEANATANRIATLDKMLLRFEASAPLQNILKREKEMVRKRERARVKEASKEYRQKSIETLEKRESRIRLQRLVTDTARWISYPSKTDVKCPDFLKKPYADFLESIDLSSKRLAAGGDPTKNDLKLANAMGSLATAIERITMSQDPGQDAESPLDTGYLDLPAGFVQQLRSMTESIKNMMVEKDFVVNTMTAKEVRQLSQMIRTINHSIKEMSTLYSNLRFANVEALGDESMSFMDSLGEIEKTSGMSNFVKWDNVLPYYAFKRFGSGGESVFEGLMDAQDKLAFLAQKIFDFQKATWTGDEAKSWGEDTHTINLPSGGTLTLTTADAMSIYCLSRRAQGLQHLLGGGVRVMGIKKGSTTAKDSRSTLSIQDIDAINSSLTDKQKKVAEAIQDFMSTECAEWGNEISMKRFLTREFTEKFYFPIESNDENLTTKDPIAQQSDLFRLLNISATKPLNKYANNEVIIRNIFDVFSGHASDMARLNAFGMPLLDYMKWMNYREKSVNEDGQVTVRGVRKSMEKAFGNAAKSYVLNLIKDVNGRPSDGGDPIFLMKWMRSAKTAAVGNSARVAMLQMTSYPRAALVLSPKSLTMGLTKKPNIDRAMKYCGIALWKSFGFYDTNISRSIEEQMKGVKDVKQKIIELSLKGAEIGDALTWGALWNACEYEVASNTKNKVGSEEFYQEVGKKLREVVYATQVVDSTLTRSQIMRSKSGMAKAATAFMSEPTLSANILMDAGYQFSMEKRRTGSAQAAWSKTGKYVGRAIAVYSIGQITAAIFEAFFDAWRDDDDEEYVEKYKAALVENLVLDIIPVNKLPLISNIAEMAMASFGVGFYSSDDISATWITQSYDAINTWKKVLANNSSATVYNALYKTTRAISSATGIPIAGAMREVVTLWNATAGAYDTTLKIRTWDNSKSEWAGQLLDALVSGNDRRAESLRKKFGDEDDLESAMRSAIKTRYESGEIDYETACKYLMLYGGQDRDEAHWKAEEWKFESENIGEDYEKYGAFYEAVRTGKNLKSVIKEYTDNGVTESTLRSQITSHFKPEYTGMTVGERANIKGYILNAMTATGKSREDAEEEMKLWDFEADYGFDYGNRKTLYLDGEITDEQLRKALINFGGYDTEKAEAQIQVYDLEDQGYDGITIERLSKFNEYCNPFGVSLDDYLQIVKFSASTKNDVDPETGKAIAYTAMKKVMAEIDSLSISSDQKTSIARSLGWSEKNIRKYKLW